MGFLSAIGSIFSPSSADKAVDGIYNGIDNMFYTDEEKAVAQQKRIETKLNLLPLFEPFKIAQRIIAISFTINFILAFWVGVAIYFYNQKLLDGYLAIIATFNIGWIMMAIITWYFTGSLVTSITGKDSARKDK